ncbi:MAG: hypothetical protein KatS3mg008_1684 [Acidimicrobiales bacterium]|nr:MAG: hypothetical protein KatS3mg008_1684 [Acidimicrobiales bacterium]
MVRVWTRRGVPVRHEVEGVSHRKVVCRQVSASLAARLVGSGVPLVVRHLDAGDGAEGC